MSAPEGEQRVTGWPEGLRLLIDNLVENAVRHGGRHVLVRLVREDDALRITVDDDGPGVPAAERERIFERFTRGAGAKSPGSGLGLALVAQQAELHGGRFELSDGPLGGLRATLTISTSPEPPPNTD